MDPHPPNSDPDDAASIPAGDQARLWAPWRMRYVGGGAKEAGCVFCNRLKSDDDVASLILFRGPHVFGIMNLFPYNTGHLMLAPNEHVATPEATSTKALAELALTLRPTLRALRRVLGCDGFNVGFNVGAVAGAGVADHLHQHVVPRWRGDANFMPILAATMVMPELIPVTYAKVRAELDRELRADGSGESESIAGHAGHEVRAVVVASDREAFLTIGQDDGFALPMAVAGPDEALWRAALRAASGVAGGADLVGWAGSSRADAAEPAAFALLARGSDAIATVASGSAWVPLDQADDKLTDPADRAAVHRAISQIGTN